jgi:hypothetical protein
VRQNGSPTPKTIAAAKKIRKKTRSRSSTLTSASSREPCGRRDDDENSSAEIPTSAIAIVARRNGAPMMAPSATSLEPSEPSRMAMIGISVSGIAVPTAARMLPVAPSPSPSRLPAHSTALVNSSAPARITAKLAASQSTST